RRSRSISAKWSSVISPSSRCISAASNCSRSVVSSFISASAAVVTVLRTQEMPSIISESRRNIDVQRWTVRSALMLASALQFQSDVDEVVRRPRARVLEGQLVESGRDFLDAAIERQLLIALDEERGVHDHLVANRPDDARGNRNIAQPLQE